MLQRNLPSRREPRVEMYWCMFMHLSWIVIIIFIACNLFHSWPGLSWTLTLNTRETFTWLNKWKWKKKKSDYWTVLQISSIKNGAGLAATPSGEVMNTYKTWWHTSKSLTHLTCLYYDICIDIIRGRQIEFTCIYYNSFITCYTWLIIHCDNLMPLIQIRLNWSDIVNCVNK